MLTRILKVQIRYGKFVKVVPWPAWCFIRTSANCTIITLTFKKSSGFSKFFAQFFKITKTIFRNHFLRFKWKPMTSNSCAITDWPKRTIHEFEKGTYNSRCSETSLISSSELDSVTSERFSTMLTAILRWRRRRLIFNLIHRALFSACSHRAARFCNLNSTDSTVRPS